MSYESIVIGSEKVVSPTRYLVGRGTVLAFPAPYVFFKRLLDIGFSLLALPLILITAAVLLVLNPVFNPGPVIFRQERMGLGGQKIKLWKFRSMTGCSGELRRCDDPLETHRITHLGRVLRRSRLDELPNFLNVLAGDMTTVGPRPDAWNHARIHIMEIPHYRGRFRVRPGITGLAQVRGGYADTSRAIERKARFDRIYIDQSGMRLDLYIIARTFWVLATGFGAR
jgi:lipopolysaccharide/colanic/teichoic acid biosynthesis glycosyltransferase